MKIFSKIFLISNSRKRNANKYKIQIKESANSQLLKDRLSDSSESKISRKSGKNLTKSFDDISKKYSSTRREDATSQVQNSSSQTNLRSMSITKRKTPSLEICKNKASSDKEENGITLTPEEPAFNSNQFSSPIFMKISSKQANSPAENQYNYYELRNKYEFEEDFNDDDDDDDDEDEDVDSETTYSDQTEIVCFNDQNNNSRKLEFDANNETTMLAKSNNKLVCEAERRFLEFGLNTIKKKISCLVWQTNKWKGADLSSLEISNYIIKSVNKISLPVDYFYIGIFCSILISCKYSSNLT